MEQPRKDMDSTRHPHSRTKTASKIQRAETADKRHKRDKPRRQAHRAREAKDRRTESLPGDSAKGRVRSHTEGARTSRTPWPARRMGQTMGQTASSHGR